MPPKKRDSGYPKGPIKQTHQRARVKDPLSALLKETNPKRKELYVAINAFVKTVVDKKFLQLQTNDYEVAKEKIFAEFSHIDYKSHNIACVNR